MDAIKSANLALRFLLELCSLVAFGYWGVSTGRGMPMKLILGGGAPLVVIVIWAVFLSPKAGVSHPQPIPFVLGLVVLGLAAVALASTGQSGLALGFAAVVVLNAVLMAIWKQ